MRSEASQVVRVISHCRLIDAASCEHIYWRRNGLRLANGWDIVSWPPQAVRGRFDEESCLSRNRFGPILASRALASAPEKPVDHRSQVSGP